MAKGRAVVIALNAAQKSPLPAPTRKHGAPQERARIANAAPTPNQSKQT